VKIDKSRFGFLKGEGSLFEKMLQRVNILIQNINDSRRYQLDWEHILSEYDRLGVGDVCEFASGYAFGWHAMNGKLSDDVSKQAMYIEIIEGIVRLRDNVI
tara:strand:- start:2277 stop:2579 length:303 start_codon:yes stop_codon:yes gene_type:complete